MAVFTKRVSASGDDGHTKAAIGFDSVNSVIYLGSVGGNSYYCFFRFTNVTVPAGATIISAKITLTAAANRAANTVNVDIYGNDVGDATAPTSTAEYNALAETTAKVDWDAISAWTADTEYDTPDISDIVQEIVDRGDFSSGNAMQFKIKDSGSTASVYRESYSFDGSAAKAALLTINYTIGAAQGTMVWF